MRKNKELDRILQKIVAIFDDEKITPEEAKAITQAIDGLNDKRTKG